MLMAEDIKQTTCEHTDTHLSSASSSSFGDFASSTAPLSLLPTAPFPPPLLLPPLHAPPPEASLPFAPSSGDSAASSQRRSSDAAWPRLNLASAARMRESSSSSISLQFRQRV